MELVPTRTEERHRGFMIATGEEARLAHLYQKYGVTSEAVGSADFITPNGDAGSKQMPLI